MLKLRPAGQIRPAKASNPALKRILGPMFEIYNLKNLHDMDKNTDTHNDFLKNTLKIFIRYI